MSRKWLPTLIIGFVLFVVGLVILEKNGIGILVMLVGIGVMIFGSVLTMAVSGRNRTRYFDNGRLQATDMPADKESVQSRSENVWDALEEKRD